MSYTVKRHSKNHTRHYKYVHISQKDFIIRNVYCDTVWSDNIPKNKLSKIKVHCSCYLCSQKTRKHGYKASDIRKINSQIYKIKQYYKHGGETDKITYKENSI